MPEYTTTADTRTALINSGFLEFFSDDRDLDAVAEWMWRNGATPEQAAEHFNVA